MSKKNIPTQTVHSSTKETDGLTKLGANTNFRFEAPDISILEAFPNRYSQRDYVITFDHPEFTSLCPMTGQPDFGRIILQYVPDEYCVESKSFKLYMGAFRNHGSFMESIVNTIADDLIALLKPRRLCVKGIFNVRGGTGITVQVEYMRKDLKAEHQKELKMLF